jgi:hypothetical protein
VEIITGREGGAMDGGEEVIREGSKEVHHRRHRGRCGRESSESKVES